MESVGKSSCPNVLLKSSTDFETTPPATYDVTEEFMIALSQRLLFTEEDCSRTKISVVLHSDKLLWLLPAKHEMYTPLHRIQHTAVNFNAFRIF
jgi:hypothetical protein